MIDFLGYMHPVMVQIPMMLFTCATIGDLLYALDFKKAIWVGHVGILFGTIACVPAILTGFGALEGLQNLDLKELNAAAPRRSPASSRLTSTAAK